MGKVYFLCLLLAAAYPLARCQPGGGQSAGSGDPCQSLGDNLFTGNCRNFVNYFKDKADNAISESNSAFQVTVNGAPKPSDACCSDVRSFSTQGCSCDQAVIQGARQNGIRENAIRIIPRATSFSRCGAVDSGGC